MIDKVAFTIQLTIVEYRREKNIDIYILLTFSHVAGTWQVFHELNIVIWENVATGNCVLQLCLIAKPLEVQPISYYYSAMLIMSKNLIYLSFF